jgi:hypothetical protein
MFAAARKVGWMLSAVCCCWMFLNVLECAWMILDVLWCALECALRSHWIWIWIVLYSFWPDPLGVTFTHGTNFILRLFVAVGTRVATNSVYPSLVWEVPTNVFIGATLCPSVLDGVGLRVPSRNIRNFSTFSCSSTHCPTARCVVAANSVCEFVDIFSKLYLSLKCLAWQFCASSFVVMLVVFYIPYWLCNWPPATEFST